MLRYSYSSFNRPLRVLFFVPRRFYSQISSSNKKDEINDDLLFNTIPKITVCGLGGAGGNIVNTLIKRNFLGADFVVANTDAQALSQSLCKKKIQLGKNLTKGLGAGAKPNIGKQATEESIDLIMKEISDSHMVFVTAGMGGGTGTGASPIVAAAAKSAGILTVGIVTKPFTFEGKARMKIAEEGLIELEKSVDTLIVIPNHKLTELSEKKLTYPEALLKVDDVLYNGIKGVTDVLVQPGIINLDFADVRSIMTGMGRALMGTGESEGRGRAKVAAEMAIHNPLLEDVSIKGAKGVLINISSGGDASLAEVNEISQMVSGAVDPDANIIFGSSIDSTLEGKIRVTLIVTGLERSVPLTEQSHTSNIPPTQTSPNKNKAISETQKINDNAHNNSTIPTPPTSHLHDNEHSENIEGQEKKKKGKNLLDRLKDSPWW